MIVNITEELGKILHYTSMELVVDPDKYADFVKMTLCKAGKAVATKLIDKKKFGEFKESIFGHTKDMMITYYTEIGEPNSIPFQG